MAQSIDIIEALSSENAFVVEILIDVRNGAGVDIEAGLTGVNAGKAGAAGGLNTDADTRLENAVAFRDDIALRVDDGTVQRMRHGADHALRGAARKLRIGIEREHVADVRQAGEIARLHGKRIERIAKEFVEIEQLAAFAFPAHPGAFARIVDAVAVKQIKAAVAFVAVLAIQTFNELNGKIDARIVFFSLLG